MLAGAMASDQYVPWKLPPPVVFWILYTYSAQAGPDRTPHRKDVPSTLLHTCCGMWPGSTSSVMAEGGMSVHAKSRQHGVSYASTQASSCAWLHGIVATSLTGTWRRFAPFASTQSYTFWP